MPWYVFALVDQRPSARVGRGLSTPVTAHPVPGGFAMVERRADVPPIAFDTLRRHDAVVARLAAAVPAILPVRFGTLLEMDEIAEALEEREEEIAAAFTCVRGRVQFTWRAAPRPARSAPRSRAVTPASPAARSERPGTAYLVAAAQAANPAPPAVFKPIGEQLADLLVQRRFSTATATMPEALYHLVERRHQARYRRTAATVVSAHPRLRVTGPFPPFAFTPQVL